MIELPGERALFVIPNAGFRNDKIWRSSHDGGALIVAKSSSKHQENKNSPDFMFQNHVIVMDLDIPDFFIFLLSFCISEL